MCAIIYHLSKDWKTLPWMRIAVHTHRDWSLYPKPRLFMGCALCCLFGILLFMSSRSRLVIFLLHTKITRWTAADVFFPSFLVSQIQSASFGFEAIPLWSQSNQFKRSCAHIHYTLHPTTASAETETCFHSLFSILYTRALHQFDFVALQNNAYSLHTNFISPTFDPKY